MRIWNPELKKYEWEHRIVWEKNKGKIPDGWVVHHINGNKKDNQIENLEIMPAKVHNSIETLKHWKKGCFLNRPKPTEDMKERISKTMKIRRKEKFWSTRKIT